MISKLPKWVEYGAFLLALVAGFVNAIGLLGFKHQSISHLSGIATLVGTGILHSDILEVFHLLFIMLSFLIGAAISGYFLRTESLKLGGNYSILLLLEAFFLIAAIYFLADGAFLGHYFASMACGLQNALATTYSGAIIRTTHVTGIFTDLGIMIGEKLRGELFDRRKALLFTLIISGFILGGGLGAFTFNKYNFYALFIPTTICVLLAFSYAIYNKKNSIRMLGR